MEIERAISSGTVTGTTRAPKDMTMGKVIMAYLNQVKVGRSTSANLERIAGGSFGATPMINLNAIVMQEFVEGRRADGVARSTIAFDLSVVIQT